MGTGTRERPSSTNGSIASSVEPDQPIQAPSLSRITGSRAVTRPPGEVLHDTEPSSETTRSTGRRLATITSSALRCFLDEDLVGVTTSTYPPAQQA